MLIVVSLLLGHGAVDTGQSNDRLIACLRSG
jgi:hypothetical protein